MIEVQEKNGEVVYSIPHWSYSAMTLFLRNRIAFKKKYILKIYDDVYSPAAVVGQAGHKAIAAAMAGAPVQDAIQVGLAFISSTSDTGIEYGKTGNREKILKDYNQAITYFFQEKPDVGAVRGIEQAIVQFFDDAEGRMMALPAKAIIDLVSEDENGDINIWDWKFVKSYTDSTADDPGYIIQAMFNYHTVKEEYGRAPKRMHFVEIKTSKNGDNTPQVQPYTIEFEKHPEYFAVFYQLYDDCTREITRPDLMFLPNFQDMFDGDQAWLMYRDHLITAEPPVVEHKTVQAKFVEKQYVASVTDKVESRYLTEEERIRVKLQEFGMPVEMQDTYRGASVVLYTLKPSRGVRMVQFEKAAQDIALALKAKTIRVQAPIPGTDLVGIEVPNRERKVIHLQDPETGAYTDRVKFAPGTLMIPIGVDVYGETIQKDLADAPHLLVSGATGSGKSVFLNVAIKTLTEQNGPDGLQMILIDPKRVELAQFKDLPHLLAPIISEHRHALKALLWAAEEMEERYARLEAQGCRSIAQYNEASSDKMTRIVIAIDEFADLMLADKAQGKTAKAASSIKRAAKRAQAEVMARRAAREGLEYEPDFDGLSPNPTGEELIVRLAQKARAVGIHLILGTQRPSVAVVSGLIKANVPLRVAFMTTSRTDSTIILDQEGAEELTGRGDGLLLDPSERGLIRFQSFFA